MVIDQCERCGGAVLLHVEHVCNESEAALMAEMKAETAKREKVARAEHLEAAALLLSTQTIPANNRAYVQGYGDAIKRLEAEAKFIRASL